MSLKNFTKNILGSTKLKSITFSIGTQDPVFKVFKLKMTFHFSHKTFGVKGKGHIYLTLRYLHLIVLHNMAYVCWHKEPVNNFCLQLFFRPLLFATWAILPSSAYHSHWLFCSWIFRACLLSPSVTSIQSDEPAIHTFATWLQQDHFFSYSIV